MVISALSHRWSGKGDFVGIKESIVAFEESMSRATVSGIREQQMRFQMLSR